MCFSKIDTIKKLTILFAFLFLSFSQNAQDSLNNKTTFSPFVNTYFGFAPKTYPVAPKSSHCFSSSIGLMWKLNGKENWHQFYRFPKVGVELFFNTFGNPEELGYSVGCVPTLELKTKKLSKHFFAKYGFGFSYFNKTYSLANNPNNYYIGSHTNAMVTISFMWKKQFTKNTQLTYGLSAFHFSNGHTQLPNVGLNLVVAHLGLQFTKLQDNKSTLVETTKGKLAYGIKLGMGRHEFGVTEKAVGGPKYNSYHVSSWISKPFKNIHVLQAGITTAYYTSFYDYIISQEVYSDKQKQKACTGVAFLGHDFVLGKFSISTQLGFYFYNPFTIKQKKIEGTWELLGEKIESINTNRFGVMYYPFKKRNTLNKLNNQLFMGVFIKANLFQADLFEYSFGYIF